MFHTSDNQNSLYTGFGVMILLITNTSVQTVQHAQKCSDCALDCDLHPIGSIDAGGHHSREGRSSLLGGRQGAVAPGPPCLSTPYPTQVLRFAIQFKVYTTCTNLNNNYCTRKICIQHVDSVFNTRSFALFSIDLLSYRYTWYMLFYTTN